MKILAKLFLGCAVVYSGTSSARVFYQCRGESGSDLKLIITADTDSLALGSYRARVFRSDNGVNPYSQLPGSGELQVEDASGLRASVQVTPPRRAIDWSTEKNCFKFVGRSTSIQVALTGENVGRGYYATSNVYATDPAAIVCKTPIGMPAPVRIRCSEI